MSDLVSDRVNPRATHVYADTQRPRQAHATVVEVAMSGRFVNRSAIQYEAAAARDSVRR